MSQLGQRTRSDKERSPRRKKILSVATNPRNRCHVYSLKKKETSLFFTQGLTLPGPRSKGEKGSQKEI